MTITITLWTPTANQDNATKYFNMKSVSLNTFPMKIGYNKKINTLSKNDESLITE